MSVINGIIHVLKSGGRWIDAPNVYGARKTLYNASRVGPKSVSERESFELKFQIVETRV